MKAKFKLILKIIIVTSAYIIAIELFLRLFIGKPPVITSNLVDDQILHHKWRPNQNTPDSSRSITYNVQTNSQSWPEAYDINQDKPKDTIRIFYVGDSNTQGVVAEEKKMATIIEKELNSKLGGKNKRFEVINTGTASYSPILYYLLIKNKILNYSPDVIAINVDMTDVGNDAFYRNFLLADPNGNPIAVKPISNSYWKLYKLAPAGAIKISNFEYFRENIDKRLKQSSKLYYYFQEVVNKITDKLLSSNDKYVSVRSGMFLPADESANWLSSNWTDKIVSNSNYTMEILNKTVNMIRSKGIKVFITGVPSYWQYTRKWSVEPFKLLENTANKNSWLYLDTYNSMKKTIEGTPMADYYWPNDPTHFGEKGNELWAQIQLAFIIEHQKELFGGLPK